MKRSDVHLGEMFEDDPQLAAFAQDLRAAADAVPAPAVRADLAAILAGEALAPSPAWLPARRRSRRSVTLRATLAGAVFGLGVGSLGVAGALPDPVQRGLSHAGKVVGVHLPAPAEGHGPPASTPGQVQRQQELEKHVPTSTPAAHRSGTSDEGSTTTEIDANDGHRGSGDDVNDHGEQERQDHATTTTTADEHRGGDGRGEDGAGVDSGTTTTTTVDDHRDGGDDPNPSGEDGAAPVDASGRSGDA